MDESKAKYNIKAVSMILGIQPGTLRAWERRYNIIEPLRNESGHRLYSDEHIAILRWLLDKVNKGFTIGQAVGLLEEGNLNLDQQDDTHYKNKLTSIVLDLEESLLNFQELKANRILDEAFNLFSIEKVVIEIIGQVLRSIGEKWERRDISVAHEHYATQYLKTRITVIFHHLQIDPLLPKAIAICGPNERHELGLLIFTLFLRRKGYEVIYLGTSVPIDDLKVVIKKVSPKYLFISCTLPDHLPETFSLVREVEAILATIKIGVGGNALHNLSKRKTEEYRDYLVGNKMEEWEEWLKITP